MAPALLSLAARLFRKVKVWKTTRATPAASSFFDLFANGNFQETFDDGAAGANNPVYNMWIEAQDVWQGSLEDKVKCTVNDDLVGVGQSLLAIATETEKAAGKFSRDKSELENAGQYYRFIVLRGLEDVDIEDSKRKNTIIAATNRYIESQAAFKLMKACADNMGKEYW
ncbi:hypothetical protein K469DRAFT_747798 [Zopfia rhizophila CBS 207.26]|uniref:Uncharacterized protein n=1 Tax=Zopfia rhizophila CBS 207.26 TaxID=1314779 RepID=A0A6A6EDI6_9PEZI|nr:hypothetical protein K469DRAFT_747798 [Zopfia rhizophila CBS 207.26]